MKYRIIHIEDPANANEPDVNKHVHSYMPQRGLEWVDEEGDPWVEWIDALPQPAPTDVLALTYMANIRQFDARHSEGRVVWES